MLCTLFMLLIFLYGSYVYKYFALCSNTLALRGNWDKLNSPKRNKSEHSDSQVFCRGREIKGILGRGHVEGSMCIIISTLRYRNSDTVNRMRSWNCWGTMSHYVYHFSSVTVGGRYMSRGWRLWHCVPVSIFILALWQTTAAAWCFRKELLVLISACPKCICHDCDKVVFFLFFFNIVKNMCTR